MVMGGRISLTNVIGGFAEVEKRDLRVDRVVMPYKVYRDVRNNHGRRDPTFDFSSRRTADVLEKRNSASRPLYAGSMWGADVYVGGDRVFIGPEPEFSHAAPVVEVDDVGVRAAFDVSSVHDVRVLGGNLNDRREAWVLPVGHTVCVSQIGKLTIIMKSHCRPVWPIDHEESIALEALREMVTESEYRRYLRTGFLMVRGASGLTYQVPREGHLVKVYDHGRMVEQICSYILDHNVPLTDRVVAFKAIIEADENDLRDRGNVYNYRNAAQAA